ncbi:MAG: AAA family ATPase [Roseibium sp.]|nr:AAA family ATPase [Roseibium sp.]MCV0427043.1 AAA family ATPase [Roseibium sp.]
MIELIHLANEGAYSGTGTNLEGLKALNFIFGPNGSGKTTISRIIGNAASYSNCSVTWLAGNPLERLVYNRDFVEKHFDAESSIKGIYTFGENVEIAQKIEALKAETATINKTLNGEDGSTGKQKERDDLENQLVEDVWKIKQNFGDLSSSFPGLNNSKRRFCAQYLIECQSNKSELRDIADIRKDAKSVFSDTLKEVPPCLYLTLRALQRLNPLQSWPKRSLARKTLILRVLSKV